MSTLSSSETAIPTGTIQARRQYPRSAISVLMLSLWAGVLAGLVEGLGLLLFQRINWARWGPTIHVSWPIVWICPIVDAAFFLILGFLVWLLSRSNRRIPQRQVLVALLSFLAFYDWLTVTGRLYHLSRIIFALGAAAASGRWFAAHEQKSMQFCRRSLPYLLGLYVAAFVAIEGGGWWSERAATARLPEAAPGAPNVLVIVIDTLRADHVSSYGYSRPTTPNLDRLAGEGVLFENAIAPSSWSLPSHVSLVTGKYLHDHKVGNVQPEPWLGWGAAGLGGFPTLGEALEQKGYRTAAFSANRTYFSHDLGFGRAFIHFEDYFNSVADCFVRTLYGREFARIYLIRSEKSLVKRTLRKLGWTSLLDQDAEGSGSYGGAFGIRKHSDEVNHELVNWIGDGSKHPFFAMLNYFDVHDPYGGPSSYPKPAWSQSTDIDRYDDGVKYVDDCLGRLMRALEEKGLSKNTLVIVTSDHGEALGQHFLMRHGHVLYWELIRVPLVVWDPRHVVAGARVSRPVSNAAIAATVMDLLSPNGQTIFPGRGLNQLWNGLISPSAWENPMSELAKNENAIGLDRQAQNLEPTAMDGAMSSLVTPQWHFIRHEKLGEQLYDWVHDPNEMNNVINTPEGQAAARTLRVEMQNPAAH
jgi:arylsulfatase A-like enzyme